MRHLKKILAFALALALVCAMSAAAFAHDAPDMSKTGSVTISVKYNGAAVPGGEFTFYRVGDIAEDDGNYSFALSAQFASSGVSLDDVASADTAKALLDYAKANNISGTAYAAGSDGVTKASGLELGLYLVAQTKAADGYQAATPFLVSVPTYTDGAYVYDIDASPKTSVDPAPPTPTPTPEPKLPQTGQLNWPVPVMAIAGLALIVLGLALRRRDEHEN